MAQDSRNTLWTPETDRRSFLVAGSLGVAGAAFGLAGCSKKSGSPKSSGSGGTAAGGAPARAYSGGPATDGTPKRGGTLRVGLFGGSSASETLNPLLVVGIADIARLFNLYEPLFSAGPNGGLTPRLAESATSNADATVWTFRLRSGVVWHNGKPFTADDVVYTVKHSWASPKNLFNSALATIVDFAKTKKVDAHTVEIHLKLAVAQFPTITCFPNLFVVQDGTVNFNNGVGTGPFKLKAFKPGLSTFVANPNYWQQGKPYLDTLLIDSSYTSEQTRLNALLAKDVDVVPQTVPSLAAAYASGGRIVIGNQPGPACVPMIMRTDKGALKDPRIRQALKLIPDRQQYVNNIYAGYATVVNDAPGYTDQYWASDLVQTQDLDKAKSLLKAAGASDFAITLKTSTVVTGMNETSTLFKQQALGAGVKVNLQEYSASTYYSPQAGIFTRDFCLDFMQQGMNSLALFYLTWMLPNAPYNESHFGTNPADKKLILDAIAETDTTKAKDKWHAVQQQQVTDGPYIIPAGQNWLDAYGTNVRGVQTTSAFTCGGYDFASGWLA